jgi:hypothetical protein
MGLEKVSNRGVNQSPSRNDYFTELAFLGLGDILYEIAGSIEQYGDIRSPDDERENDKGKPANHKQSTAAI